MAYLILVRHGESEWNAKGVWTGITDVALSERGRREAQLAGAAIKDITINVCYCSALTRAKETLGEIRVVCQCEDIPVNHHQALNERDYGELTGKNKWQVREDHGEEQFMKWRRSWDFPVPGGETLKDVYHRVVPYYEQTIRPDLIAGKNVIISAHGNSLRALIKHLEGIADDIIPTLEIATGEVYLYELDTAGVIVRKEIRSVAAAAETAASNNEAVGAPVP